MALLHLHKQGVPREHAQSHEFVEHGPILRVGRVIIAIPVYLEVWIGSRIGRNGGHPLGEGHMIGGMSRMGRQGFVQRSLVWVGSRGGYSFTNGILVLLMCDASLPIFLGLGRG